MEMTLSRKVLNAASIMDYFIGCVSVVISILMLSLSMLITISPAFAQHVPGNITANAAIAVAAAIAFDAVFSFCSGFIGRKAAKDPSKIMPVWFLSLVMIVLKAFDIAINAAKQTPVSEMSGSFMGLAIAILLFVLACNIRKEAGK